jgi:D-alanyl-D-alanine carboxypeptidase/D-alanyl-D-alanine-endopeptidase (penicillin-binding protein 4)
MWNYIGPKMFELGKFSILFFFYIISIFPQGNNRLSTQIDSLLSDQFFQSTLAAIDIYDLTTHETLFSKNEKILLHPASNMKLLTTSAALLFLEPDYQFNTYIYYTGNILNNILYGDLYVVGGGDPLFKTGDVDSLVRNIHRMDIKEITGNIYGDVSWKDSLYWGSGWMWDDEASTDAPYLSALNLNANSVQVCVSPANPGEKAKIYLKPETGYFTISNNTTTTPSDGINDYDVTRDWVNQKNTIMVDGFVRNRIIIDSSKIWEGVNVYNPAMYFITLFYEGLIKSGIRVHGIPDIKTAPGYAVQLNVFSHSIDSVIVHVNKPSYNLGAEMIMYALAVKYCGKPATAQNGIDIIKNLIDLIGMNPDNYYLADGSGVSRYNLVSAELLISLLKYMYENQPEFYQKLYYSLPVAGVDGTLKKRMLDTPAQNNVHAKTGTLNGVSALSGYVTAKNNDKIAFSILTQNYVGKSSAAKGFEDRICEILADYQ